MVTDYKSMFQNALNDQQALAKKIKSLEYDVIQAAEAIGRCFVYEGKVLLAGNGGSAADAQHWAAEWIVRFTPKVTRKALPAIALTTDTSILTAGSNDLGYDNVVSRQVEAFATPNDVLILISTSGNSQNLINAANTANDIGCFVIGILGNDGGKLMDVCDINVIVPHKVTARIQEMHCFIGHMLCQISENYFIENSFTEDSK